MNIHSPIPTTGNALLDEAELLVTVSAAALQISATLHAQAEQNYNALADYIDAEGSPLQGRVLGVFASGSFAIGAAILGKTKSTQHDVDAVLVLGGAYLEDPETVLNDVFRAITRPDSQGRTRYQGKTMLNSRCITVTYDDGRSIDIMPVCEFILGQPDSDECHYLFHHKAESGKLVQSYHKRVRPKGFKRWYQDEDTKLVASPKGFLFEDAFRRSVHDQQVLTTKAEAEPFPEAKLMEEKSLRTLVIQLLKRNRHIGRRRGKIQKCPPSVIIATMAMQSGRFMESLLVDELINVATSIATRLKTQIGTGRPLEIYNPSWDGIDKFSDRWGSLTDMREYLTLLQELVVDMKDLKTTLSSEARKSILRRAFGEDVSVSSLKTLSERRANNRFTGRTVVGRTGAIGTLPRSHAYQKKSRFFGQG